MTYALGNWVEEVISRFSCSERDLFRGEEWVLLNISKWSSIWRRDIPLYNFLPVKSGRFFIWEWHMHANISFAKKTWTMHDKAARYIVNILFKTYGMVPKMLMYYVDISSMGGGEGYASEKRLGDSLWNCTFGVREFSISGAVVISFLHKLFWDVIFLSIGRV